MSITNVFLFFFSFCIWSIIGDILWPNPPTFLDTLADGIILQQFGHLTFAIICDFVEKDVLTLVSIYIDKIG